MNKIYIRDRDPTLPQLLAYLNEFERSNNISKDMKVNLDTVILDFNNCKYISPSALTVLNLYLKSLINNNKSLNIKILGITSDLNTYMSRIDFYKNLNIKTEENFYRWNELGRFTTIKQVNNDNRYDVINEVLNIIINNKFDLSPETHHTLYWSLGELIDNVFSHSKSKLGCMLVAQNFNDNYNNKIEVCIADVGVGISNTLGTIKDYEELDIHDLLYKATEKTITSSGDTDGRGNGLYYTRRFIELNKGNMEILSNNGFFKIKSGKFIKLNYPYFRNWNGTIIKIEINKNTDMDIGEIFEVNVNDPYERCSLPVGYLDDERVERILW